MASKKITNEKKNITLVPKIRFPEFENNGEWELKKLGEVVEKNTKKNKDCKIKIVQSISNKFGFINQNEYFEDRTIASKDQSNYYVVEKGTFGYNPSRIDVGSLALKKDNISTIVSPLYITFRANNELLNDYFLFYWFRTHFFYIQMKNSLKGGVRNSLDFNGLSDLKIPLPTLPEQQKIADCLSSLDEQITAEEKKLELYKQHKKGLLQKLFPKEGQTTPELRFPEFQNAPEWELKKLGEVGEFFKGKNISKSDIVINGKTPCIRYGELYTHYNEKIIKKVISFTNLPLKNLFLSKSGDILIPSSGETKEDISRASCIKLDNVAIGGDINIIRTKLIGEFLSYYISFSLKKTISQIAQGDTVVHLYNEQLKKLLIFIPTLPEQQKIADCLSSLDELIESQTKKIELLKQHKKGLLQQLFPVMTH